MWCDLGESIRNHTCDIFSFLFDWSPHYERYVLLRTCLNRASGSKVTAIDDSQINRNKTNVFLFLSVSHNQCSKLPTDPARSQHIMSTQPVTMGVDWHTEIGRIMKVSLMFDICTYCVFTLYSSIGVEYLPWSTTHPTITFLWLAV